MRHRVASEAEATRAAEVIVVDHVAVCDANDLAHEGLGFGGEWNNEKE